MKPAVQNTQYRKYNTRVGFTNKLLATVDHKQVQILTMGKDGRGQLCVPIQNYELIVEVYLYILN